MDQNAWTMLLIGIALTAALFALGVELFTKLRSEASGSARNVAIEAALLPILYQGICAAYRLNEISLDQFHQALAGADKKKIADSIYAMLPDKIGKFDLVEVKRVVTQERFEALTQEAFDLFNRFYVEHQAHFDQMFQQWKAANAPASITLPSPAPAPTPTPAPAASRVPAGVTG